MGFNPSEEAQDSFFNELAQNPCEKSGGDRFNSIQQKISPCSGNRESPHQSQQSGALEEYKSSPQLETAASVANSQSAKDLTLKLFRLGKFHMEDIKEDDSEEKVSSDSSKMGGDRKSFITISKSNLNQQVSEKLTSARNSCVRVSKVKNQININLDEINSLFQFNPQRSSKVLSRHSSRGSFERSCSDQFLAPSSTYLKVPKLQTSSQKRQKSKIEEESIESVSNSDSSSESSSYQIEDVNSRADNSFKHQELISAGKLGQKPSWNENQVNSLQFSRNVKDAQKPIFQNPQTFDIRQDRKVLRGVRNTLAVFAQDLDKFDKNLELFDTFSSSFSRNERLDTSNYSNYSDLDNLNLSVELILQREKNLVKNVKLKQKIQTSVWKQKFQ